MAFSEQGLRNDVVLSSDAPVVRERPHDQLPGVHAVGRLALGAKVFRGDQLWFDCRNDSLRNLVLHGEHVGETAVVTLGPHLTASGDVIEFRS